jgi:hypothetical protein
MTEITHGFMRVFFVLEGVGECFTDVILPPAYFTSPSDKQMAHLNSHIEESKKIILAKIEEQKAAEEVQKAMQEKSAIATPLN